MSPNTTIYIPDNVHKAAREAKINISRVCRKAIQDTLADRGIKIEVPEPKWIALARCPRGHKFPTSSLLPTCKECESRFRLTTRGRIAGMIKGDIKDIWAMKSRKRIIM